MSHNVLLSLINTHSMYLRKLALTLTANSFDADDLYQTTILKVLQHQDSFDPSTNFKAWSQTILRNNFINEYRRKARQKTKNVGDTQQILDSMTSTANAGYHNLNMEYLERQIDTLDVTRKTVFKLYHQGFTYEEISAKTNTPIALLCTQVFVAKKLLQQKLRHVELAA